MKVVQHLFSQVRNRGDNVAQIGSESLSAEDFQKLKENQWLNDNIINFVHEMFETYVNSLRPQRVKRLSSFLFTKISKDLHGAERWTRKINLFQYEIIAIPIHLAQDFHWIEVTIFRKWITKESTLQTSQRLYTSTWPIIYAVSQNFPQQEDPVNCGIWTCMNMLSAAVNNPRLTLNIDPNRIRLWLAARILWVGCRERLTEFTEYYKDNKEDEPEYPVESSPKTIHDQFEEHDDIALSPIPCSNSDTSSNVISFKPESIANLVEGSTIEDMNSFMETHEKNAEDNEEVPPQPKRRKLSDVESNILKHSKRPSFAFTKRMRECLRTRDELTDEHISLAQVLLKAQFPHIDGLQPPLPSRVDDFRTVEQESIQIHKLENEQWVTSSNIGQKVALYYSNFPGFQIDPHLSQQLGVIYQLAALEEDSDSEEQDFQNLSLHVELPYVQQQVRVNDSGLFAIAFAVHLARGEDLTTAKYDQQQMREHLAKCFRRKSLTPFPLETNISNKQRPSKRRGTTIELCRMCLMPATYDNSSVCPQHINILEPDNLEEESHGSSNGTDLFL
ncbi:uncharacterized protein LOC134193051 isoform X2 [Corticium candelabrum]|uniref:uncharacterized protein LOC134193051 isoform X2 n=1 Tax=Corticium candelabrum TaxID=121492 RepID=UPI002E2535AB|nr:uncharacterized protein LOC134193051 isoform X2 [Corticium candelabrum]